MMQLTILVHAIIIIAILATNSVVVAVAADENDNVLSNLDTALGIVPISGRSLVPKGCKDYAGTGVTTRFCNKVIAGRKVESIFEFDANGKSHRGFCVLVDGIPCASSYYCGNKLPNGNLANYIDCRNNLKLSKDKVCWGMDCKGNCLSKKVQAPSFANGDNGCTFMN
jgi:hypothetical protein